MTIKDLHNYFKAILDSKISYDKIEKLAITSALGGLIPIEVLQN